MNKGINLDMFNDAATKFSVKFDNSIQALIFYSCYFIFIATIDNAALEFS